MMASRIEQFEALLALHEGLLESGKRRQVASLLAFAGCSLPLPVWQTREELDAAPEDAVVVDSEETLWECYGTGAAKWGTPGDSEFYGSDVIRLPVQVRWLP